MHQSAGLYKKLHIGSAHFMQSNAQHIWTTDVASCGTFGLASYVTHTPWALAHNSASRWSHTEQQELHQSHTNTHFIDSLVSISTHAYAASMGIIPIVSNNILQVLIVVEEYGRVSINTFGCRWTLLDWWLIHIYTHIAAATCQLRGRHAPTRNLH